MATTPETHDLYRGFLKLLDGGLPPTAAPAAARSATSAPGPGRGALRTAQRQLFVAFAQLARNQVGCPLRCEIDSGYAQFVTLCDAEVVLREECTGTERDSDGSLVRFQHHLRATLPAEGCIGLDRIDYAVKGLAGEAIVAPSKAHAASHLRSCVGR